MVRDRIPLREKTGFLRKILCCNCLGEKRIIHHIFGSKCLSCGAINDKTIMLDIWMVPETIGNEL